ncbi:MULTISPECIES: methionine--tRNA ligase [Paenibacillus]|uniref:methionine--tRNA ligase n=1 Tax=Paenibacillus TaxID=44249 RepID=UPI0003E2B5CC|nr:MULTISPECIES: methionine--tRNA ligase [Paenibacillus]ETT45863.1 methionyl-tRNA ligase [Paenibacillus sp. FSL H8-237]OMD10555.1 methionine--tRNA ligase [Paenibacillus odorifer]OME22717.1 methionine--tRNA ligase [Paenibacillus odorifer]OME31824.1 methionine--tRNA ligase [Paenibacillus odorifer]OME40990.1 methionine--tRNA ligase [Paenibacillus odorifer]
MSNVFIGGAWPYANGSLHLGRLSSVLPGDVLARYFRSKGDNVLYVSGSDCHGTPVAVQAANEGITPGAFASRYHEEFLKCFKQLGFSYDLYTRTDQPQHHKVVQELFTKLLENGHLYKKTIAQCYCEVDQRFLPDRYVEGTCPVCGQRARGDQCDYCSTILDPADLLDRVCKLCGNTPSERPTEHYYLSLSNFQSELTEYVEEAQFWRDNAIKLTKRYLQEELQDRAVTRDLSWGVDVPVAGFEDKKIYVWIEAVSGYLSASKQWAAQSGGSWEDFWLEEKGEITAYYVHGKDNIPFHTLIWPAVLLGAGGLHLPDRIISSEYLTLEGQKFSTSRNWAVWVPDILERYQPDSIRYFLIANGPEKRDTDFSWREFIYSHNGELLGAFGNFVNRSLAFVDKFYEGKVPNGQLDKGWNDNIDLLYLESGRLIEAGNLKDALEYIFSYVRKANQYFDLQKPWIQIKEDQVSCDSAIYTCVQIIANLANLLHPFLPFSCDKIRGFLSLELPNWQPCSVPPYQQVTELQLLFERIDINRIKEEEDRLVQQQVNK